MFYLDNNNTASNILSCCCAHLLFSRNFSGVASKNLAIVALRQKCILSFSLGIRCKVSSTSDAAFQAQSTNGVITQGLCCHQVIQIISMSSLKTFLLFQQLCSNHGRRKKTSTMFQSLFLEAGQNEQHCWLDIRPFGPAGGISISRNQNYIVRSA